MVAVFGRYLDPDRLLRHNERLISFHWIAVDGVADQLSTINDHYQLPAWLLQVGSSTDAALQIHTSQRTDGFLVLQTGQGGEFTLGKLDNGSPADSRLYQVDFDSGDLASLEISRSMIPYYAGWQILSSAPLFRYFRYYTLRIHRAGGAELTMEWKFTTYRRAGQWTPDQFGSQGEGLVQLALRVEK